MKRQTLEVLIGQVIEERLESRDFYAIEERLLSVQFQPGQLKIRKVYIQYTL